MSSRFLVPSIDLAGGAATQHAVFFDADTYIDCGSDSSLNDLHAGEFTVECWVNMPVDTEVFYPLIHTQEPGTSTGYWRLQFIDFTGFQFGLIGTVYYASTIANSYYRPSPYFLLDGSWHHLTMYFNAAGDKKVYLAIDGQWIASYTLQQAGIGTHVTDANNKLTLGDRYNQPASLPNYSMAWARISDNDRYGHGGADFTPPAKDSPPAVDGNTVEQWNLNEGSGSTAAAEVSSPTNNGTITNGTWENL